VPEPPASPLLSKAYLGRGTDELALSEAAPATRAAPAVRAVTPEPQRQAEPQKPSLFKSVFGFGNAAKPAPAPHPHRQEPAMHVDTTEPREPARAAVRPAQIDEIGLEIPAFLRRSP
jgi:cell division protein FtsZ